MRAISLFSGVGGIELGFDQVGIHTVLQAEIDPDCREVLARSWPTTPCLEDVRHVTPATALRGGPIDLVYGGYPCQDISNSYARGVYAESIGAASVTSGGGGISGLAGGRSGLFWEFHRVAAETRAPWIVIENVANLRRSNAGRDLFTVLSALDELGYGLAWSVLDARGFGVPQQRRRLYIVGHLGDGDGPAEVLDLAARRTRHAGEGGARGLAYGSGAQDGAGMASLPDEPLSIAENQQAEFRLVPFCPSLTTGGGKIGQDYQGFVWDDVLRRYTLEEQEALMGWPRGHTRYRLDGSEFSDTQRQRFIGNGVCAPVARWIGERLVAVDDAWWQTSSPPRDAWIEAQLP